VLVIGAESKQFLRDIAQFTNSTFQEAESFLEG
jgi:hypothetical protein